MGSVWGATHALPTAAGLLCVLAQCMQRLLFALQTYARERDHLTHFLTYADNNAVGYFAKQGFTKEITLERERVRPSPSAEALAALSIHLVDMSSDLTMA